MSRCRVDTCSPRPDTGADEQAEDDRRSPPERARPQTGEPPLRRRVTRRLATELLPVGERRDTPDSRPSRPGRPIPGIEAPRLRRPLGCVETAAGRSQDRRSAQSPGVAGGQSRASRDPGRCSGSGRAMSTRSSRSISRSSRSPSRSIRSSSSMIRLPTSQHASIPRPCDGYPPARHRCARLLPLITLVQHSGRKG